MIILYIYKANIVTVPLSFSIAVTTRPIKTGLNLAMIMIEPMQVIKFTLVA